MCRSQVKVHSQKWCAKSNRRVVNPAVLIVDLTELVLLTCRFGWSPSEI